MRRKWQTRLEKAQTGEAAKAGYGSLLHRSKLRLALLMTVVAVAAGVIYVTAAAHPGQTAPDSAPVRRLASTTTKSAHTTASQNTTIAVDSSSSNSGSRASSNSTSVTLNGESLPVPPNGNFHRDITDQHGETSIDISQDSSAPGQSTNSISLEFHSKSTVSVEGGTGD